MKTDCFLLTKSTTLTNRNKMGQCICKTFSPNPVRQPHVYGRTHRDFLDACSHNRIDVIRDLMNDPTLDDVCLRCGFLIAISCKQIAAVELLLAHPNINVNDRHWFYQTPLMNALTVAEHSLPEDLEKIIHIISLVLAHPNIDLSIEDAGGETALDYAKGNDTLVAMIRAKMPPVVEQEVFVMSVPRDTDDAISYETIENGTLMVDFHNERRFGRYYTKASYDALSPKRNLVTRKPILKSEVVYYLADVK